MGFGNAKVKWIKVLMIIGFVCMIAVVLNLFFDGHRYQNGGQTSTVKTDMQNNGLQLYLVKDSSSIYADDKINIEQYELETEPLLSKSDIVSYNWNTHCMKIKNNGEFNQMLLQRRFVVMADRKRIYSGVFWSAIFSMKPPQFSVYLNNIEESGNSIILALGSWRPGEKIPPELEKVLADPRIQKVLERDSQMYKAYMPEHFERPDYIDVYKDGESYGYGGFDWEKRDHLLKLLDQRYVEKLDYARDDLSLKDDESLAALHRETIIILGYHEQRELTYNIRGTDVIFSCRELLMPVTGEYGDLLYFKDDNGYGIRPLGKLERFMETDMLKKDSSHKEQASRDEPEGIHLLYSVGKPFQHITNNLYEFGNEDARKVKEEAALGKLLKGIPGHKPQRLPLTLKFGRKDDRWFHVFTDGETLFFEGKYYYNPALAGRILTIAREHCGFEIFDASAFKGLVKVKYSFRTNTRTVECSTEDKTTLAEMEKGLQKVQYDMGGGCPFSDGVLTLVLENGSVMEISMASDDCPLMFMNGYFLKYSDELHDLLVHTFDNFPYVTE
jgi:hypothetical protein